MKDLSGFKAPRWVAKDIHAAADDFRNKYGGGKIPVDIEDIIEFDLNLDIRPTYNLSSNCNTDAFLSADCKTIHVDSDHYSKPNYLPRIRFSLAHEIGHLVLHKDVIPILRPSSLEEWKEIVTTIPEDEYSWLEQHAYEFAGRLLVPRENLIADIHAITPQIKSVMEINSEVDQDDIMERFSSRICHKYAVSWEVIAKRIRKEKVWPV